MVYFSGIISVMFAAIACNRYFPVFAVSFTDSIKERTGVWAITFEKLLFFYIGRTACNNWPTDTKEWGFVFGSMFACLLGRIAQIYPLAALLNRHHQNRLLMVPDAPVGIILPASYQHMMLLAGLRGPIAYATALLFPTSDQADHSNVVAASSAITVVSTTTILGALTIPALKWLNIQHGSFAGSLSDSGQVERRVHEVDGLTPCQVSLPALTSIRHNRVLRHA